MRNTHEDRPVYQRAGEYWDGIEDLLSDVQQKKLTTELTAKERKKTCRTSRLGYAICKEPICTECWEEGYDKHS